MQNEAKEINPDRNRKLMSKIRADSSPLFCITWKNKIAKDKQRKSSKAFR